MQSANNADRQVNAVPGPARGWRDPGRVARDGHTELTGLLDSALDRVLPPASSWERSTGCGKQAAARILHQGRTPKRRRRSRFSPREKGGGAEGLISFLPVVS